MVSKEKSRVMITLPNKIIEELQRLCDLYGMPLSQMIVMLVVDKLRERNK